MGLKDYLYMVCECPIWPFYPFVTPYMPAILPEEITFWIVLTITILLNERKNFYLYFLDLIAIKNINFFFIIHISKNGYYTLTSLIFPASSCFAIRHGLKFPS